MSKVFESNLDLLSQKSPLLGLKLYRVKGKVLVDSSSIFFSCHTPVAIIYRLASLSDFNSLKTYLSHEEHHVIIIESFVEELIKILEEENVCFLLEHPAVSFYLHEDMQEEDFLKIAWQCVFLEPTFITAFEDDRFIALKEKMLNTCRGVFLTASEYGDFGNRALEQMYKNVFSLKRSLVFNTLSFENIPAIICGAGASLKLQLEELKKLNQKALLFGVGSALEALENAGVEPHFGSIVDPDPLYHRFSRLNSFQLPYFYQLRSSSKLISLLHGEKLLVRGSGEHALEQYIFERLGYDSDFIESGWNVANFTATIAAMMGCNPIIFVGMDMTYAPNQEYAEGVNGAEEKKHISLGDSSLTRHDLLMGKEFFIELKERFPKTEFMNATAKGLYIEGIEHLSLQEVEMLLTLTFDLKALVHAQLAQVPRIEIERLEQRNIILKLIESLERVKSLIKRLLEQLNNCHDTIINDDKIALEEIELEEEVMYTHYLAPLWAVWRWIVLRSSAQGFYTREQKIQQLIFFDKVIQEHGVLLCQVQKMYDDEESR